MMGRYTEEKLDWLPETEEEDETFANALDNDDDPVRDEALEQWLQGEYPG